MGTYRGLRLEIWPSGGICVCRIMGEEKGTAEIL